MGMRPKYDRAGRAVYRSPRWARVRFLVKRRDQWRCVACGASGVRLEVDHKVPIRERPDLAYAPANLQMLCVSCHARKTQREVGLTYAGHGNPKRRAWKKLVRKLARPNRAAKESRCLKQ